MISIHPVLFTVWAAMAACLLALIAYRTQITRYEEDQLFLNDNVNQKEHAEQDEIVRKVNKIQPMVRIFAGATGLMTMGIVGSIAWQAVQALQH